jgi:uncharacterized protein (DUF1330 family)
MCLSIEERQMEEPIYMLNALWFKKDGGLQKYLEYIEAVRPLLEKIGAEFNESYYPEEGIIGEWDPDVFFLVKYPIKTAFESMVNSSAYKEIMHLREEAIEKSLLIRCKPFDWKQST